MSRSVSQCVLKLCSVLGGVDLCGGLCMCCAVICCSPCDCLLACAAERALTLQTKVQGLYKKEPPRSYLRGASIPTEMGGGDYARFSFRRRGLEKVHNDHVHSPCCSRALGPSCDRLPELAGPVRRPFALLLEGLRVIGLRGSWGQWRLAVAGVRARIC